MSAAIPRPGRRSVLLAAAAAGTALCLPAIANERYPSRPVRVITPIPPGGIVDSAVRIVTEALSVSSGQPFIVDNRPGGSYVIGVKTAASAPADGHNLLAMHVGVVTAQETMRQFDLLEHFTGVGMIGALPSAITVSARSPFRTLDDLVEFGRENKGAINYATPGVGSLEHLKSVELERLCGFSSQNIATKGGPDMLRLLMQGDCHYSVMPLALADPFVKKGQLRFLAVTTGSRVPSHPELPTAGELGVQLRPYTAWMGLMIRKDAPNHAANTAAGLIAAAMKSAALREKYESMGMTTESTTSPAEFTQLVRSEVNWLAGFIKEIDFKLA